MSRENVADAKNILENQIRKLMAGRLAEEIYVERGGRKDSRDSTCFHEAGHCVFAVHAGRTPGFIEIFKNGGGVIRDDISTAMIWDESHRDEAQITKLNQDLTICDAAPDLERLRGETRQFLLDHWHEVGKIARHLISLTCDGQDAHIGRSAIDILMQFANEGSDAKI